MPDSEGKLTAEEIAKVNRWLEDHWPKPWECPVSKHTSWDLAENLVRVTPWSEKGYLVGGGVYVHVMLVCKGCGYTLMLNATRMGLVSKEVKKEPENG